MPIVDTTVPVTSENCEQAIGGIVETYPGCRKRTLTYTAFGRPVEALEIGNGRRKVLFQASHHANEWITTLILLKFGEDLAAAAAAGKEIYGIPAAEVMKKATICMVPLVNPDGVDLVTGAIEPGDRSYENAKQMASFYPNVPFTDGWKANLMGVDLNLNYAAGWYAARDIKFSQGYTRPGPRDFVGRGPFTQPESRAMADYTREVDPVLTLSYHSQGEVIYWKYLDYEVEGAQELAEQFGELSGYAVQNTPYASGFAGYKDWFIKDYRRPGFTIEVGQGTNPLPLDQFPKIYKDNLGILMLSALGSLPQTSPSNQKQENE